MTTGPDRRAPTDTLPASAASLPASPAADGADGAGLHDGVDPSLARLEREVASRLVPLLGRHARCRVTTRGRHVAIDVDGPPLDAPARRAVAVRALDAVRAMGRTFGDIEVTYSTRFTPSTPKETVMQAHAGDRITVKSHRVGEPDHDGEILETRGADGGPPYRVRWDTGRVTLIFPGPDAEIRHTDHFGR
ncbi:MAG TPA: DUF1918 domain-containing protein [Acidimicrobiales bacterium]